MGPAGIQASDPHESFYRKEESVCRLATGADRRSALFRSVGNPSRVIVEGNPGPKIIEGSRRGATGLLRDDDFGPEQSDCRSLRKEIPVPESHVVSNGRRTAVE